jgi:hypothetical protein
VRLWVLKVTIMKTAVFWVVPPYSVVEVYRRFGGCCCFLTAYARVTASHDSAINTSVETAVAWFNLPSRNLPGEYADDQWNLPEEPCIRNDTRTSRVITRSVFRSHAGTRYYDWSMTWHWGFKGPVARPQWYLKLQLISHRLGGFCTTKPLWVAIKWSIWFQSHTHWFILTFLVSFFFSSAYEMSHDSHV